MDDERIAKEAEKSKREANVEESVDISVHTPLHSSVCSPSVKPRKSPQERRNLAPLDAGSKPDLDYWEFDDQKGAWKRVHIRPRKRLFTPVGNDCPFDPSDVLSERKTMWKCKGKTSWFDDNWQEGSPTRRISARSWLEKHTFTQEFVNKLNMLALWQFKQM